ncbi:hypothetical protein CEP54_006235 [Fusarium duplospermum]|uniref:Uncharacterized protein n=1 Tax=Fusarium duplospermum TaxID=1325734 RepID=A0A428Q889_9HYPO|nr:hypothetical protein CEP54_006235 [Fusarium duplospermum]
MSADSRSNTGHGGTSEIHGYECLSANNVRFIMLMPGKLTVDPSRPSPWLYPCAAFPFAAWFLPISSTRSFLFYDRTAEPGKSAPSTRPPEPRSPSLHRLRRPSYRSSHIPSIYRSLQLSGSRRPPKGHCTNAPEVAGARQKTDPIPSIHPIPSEPPARVLHAQPRFFSQPASLVPSKPTRVP